MPRSAMRNFRTGATLDCLQWAGVAERPSKIHGTLIPSGLHASVGAAERANTHKLASRLCSKPAAVPKLGQSAGSSLRRIRSKFSRIGPEQNRLCRIADIGGESEGRVLFGEQPARCAVRPC